MEVKPGGRWMGAGSGGSIAPGSTGGGAGDQSWLCPSLFRFLRYCIYCEKKSLDAAMREGNNVNQCE